MNRAVLVADPAVRRSSPPRRRRRAGVTMTEVAFLIVVALVLCAVLFPLYAKSRKIPRRRGSPSSHQKQIGIGLLSYLQDYDERFPPAEGSAVVNGKTVKTNWAVDTYLPSGSVVPGVLQAYMKNNQVFRAEDAPSGARLTYMYNDLVTTERQANVVMPALTVLTTYSADVLGNVGHAYERNGVPPDAVINAKGRCDAGKGTFVTETVITHTSGGSNYAFVDGHVKWFKPGAVYHPPLSSASRHHRDKVTGVLLGPDPKGGMTWNGITWAGTFHLD